MEGRGAPGAGFREGLAGPRGRQEGLGRGARGVPAGGGRICRGESAGSAPEAGAALGRDTRGERKRATCSCDRGFDLHPGSGHSPFQGELERLGDTGALSPPAHQVTGRWALLPHTSWAE